jgi:chromosomal replication initiator protein
MLDNESPRNPHSIEFEIGAAFGSSRLNPRFTFENFMVGRSNRMAYAGATAVGENPARSYNPLCIYGQVGLGKTHLAQAIGQDAMARGYTVLYTTTEAFGNDLFEALRTRAMERFRAKYRSADVLLIDDVQYAEGKTNILEELFFTIDSLHQHNKQSVLCSDRHPGELRGLTDQMRSRLIGGSIVDIDLPDMELRTAILRSKPEVYENNVPLDIADFVARQVKSNVRVLEGALQNVIAMAKLQHLPYTLELAEEAIKPTLERLEKPPKRSAQGIVELVSRYYGVTEAEIYSKQRDRHIVFPRQITMYLFREELVMPFEAIGKHLGGRDHSTVMYGYDKIGRRMATDDEVQREIHSLRQKIYDG